MIKVYIDNRPYQSGIGIWIFDEREGRRYKIQQVQFEFKECVPYADEVPSIAIPYRMEAQFLQAFAEALSKQGIKTESDHKIQGILEATKYHLEDMRKIAKAKT